MEINKDLIYPDGWLPLDDFSFTYGTLTSSLRFIYINASDDVSKYISEGIKVKIEQGANIIYGFVCILSNKTEIGIFYNSNYTVDTSQTINKIYISTSKNPVGFPVDKSGWTLSMKDTTTKSGGDCSTGFNRSPFYLKVPIGTWTVKYRMDMQGWGAGGRTTLIQAGLCKSNTRTPVDESIDFFQNINVNAAPRYNSNILKGQCEFVNNTHTDIYITSGYANSLGNEGFNWNSCGIGIYIKATPSYL